MAPVQLASSARLDLNFRCIVDDLNFRCIVDDIAAVPKLWGFEVPKESFARIIRHEFESRKQPFRPEPYEGPVQKSSEFPHDYLGRHSETPGVMNQ